MGLSKRFVDGSQSYVPQVGVSSSGSLKGAESGEHVPHRPGATPAISVRDQMLFDLQRHVQTHLAVELEAQKLDISHMTSSQARRILDEHLQRIIDIESQKLPSPLNRSERNEVLNRCVAEIMGYGPIDSLLQDDTITEIMINGPYDVYAEQYGKTFKTLIRFQNRAHLMAVIDRIVSQVGRRVDETSPMVDARLKDGSRVNVVLPPIALDGPIMTIRKFSRRPLQPQDLVDKGTISREMLYFLDACVKARFNIVVSGGTNTGKSTMLNVLSVFIPSIQRIVTIEDSAELQLQQEHVVRMESRPASVEGKHEITIRNLVANALRMRPDRIIVGECRGGEALDMLQAMNTGHEGSMTTVHANSAREVIKRLEILSLQAGIDLPQRAIREQITSAIHLIVHLNHFEDGTRRVESIAELWPGSNDTVEVVDIFGFQRTGTDANGGIIGRLKATGVKPRRLDELERLGFQLPPTLFQA